VVARNFFANLAAHPVATGAGRVAVVLAAIVAATIATAIATGVAAGIAAAIAMVTAEAIEAPLDAAQEGDLFAALPVTTVHHAADGRAFILARDAALDAGPLFRVRYAHLHAADLIVALGNQVPAGHATGARFRNTLGLGDVTHNVATFLPVAGLLDHVGLGDPFVASDRAVLLVAGAAVRSALGWGNLFLRIFLLQVIGPKRKCQHGCHSPSQHRHTNSLPDHALSLYCVG